MTHHNHDKRATHSTEIDHTLLKGPESTPDPSFEITNLSLIVRRNIEGYPFGSLIKCEQRIELLNKIT